MPSRASRDWQLRIQDILQAAQDIADFTERLSFKDFQNKKMLAQLKVLQIINNSSQLKNRYTVKEKLLGVE